MTPSDPLLSLAQTCPRDCRSRRDEDHEEARDPHGSTEPQREGPQRRIGMDRVRDLARGPARGRVRSAGLTQLHDRPGNSPASRSFTPTDAMPPRQERRE
jgi:hypothetical protein